MFQDGEVVTLVLALAVLPVAGSAWRGLRVPGVRLLVAGFMWIVLASVANVLETSFWPDRLNFLQHLSYAAAGLTFLGAVIVLRRDEHGARGPRP